MNAAAQRLTRADRRDKGSVPGAVSAEAVVRGTDKLRNVVMASSNGLGKRVTYTGAIYLFEKQTKRGVAGPRADFSLH
uniref:40S ribosomal protein S14 n=1 Tax=Steinernema glaseri TaxID=37863 RepID=A0A1I7Y717_9BILA